MKQRPALRCAFAGSGDFALPALKALLQADRHPVLVLTRPERPAGRGLKAKETRIAHVAKEAGLALVQPTSLREASIQGILWEAHLDVLITAAYGLLLPPQVLRLPRWGCINLHASLLPRWRGAAPIARTLLAGDAETGVSIFQMDEGLDTGPLLAQSRIAVAEGETAGSLQEKLAQLAASMLLDVLDRMASGSITPHPQDSTGACYAAKLTTDEAVIDWQQDARAIERLVRAMTPKPRARFWLGERMILVHEARIASWPQPAAPGTIVQVDAAAVVVACGSDALSLETLQPAGGRPMPAAAFWRGLRQPPRSLGAMDRVQQPVS